MEKGRLTQRRSIISNARVIKAITECGPLLLASVGNSPTGMNGAAFFCFGAGRGGAEEKNFGAEQGENARGGAG